MLTWPEVSQCYDVKCFVIGAQYTRPSFLRSGLFICRRLHKLVPDFNYLQKHIVRHDIITISFDIVLSVCCLFRFDFVYCM